MDERHAPLSPDEAERRYAAMLDAAGLPRFSSTSYDPDIHELVFRWDDGLEIELDLSCGDLAPIEDEERDAILGRPHHCEGHEPIHVTVSGSADDPREVPSIPGVVVHRVPPLHPDDLTVVRGIPVTSPSRTLIDCAELATIDELRDMFRRARELGLLDPVALRAARARVEWRPSLAMLDQVIEEFCG